MKIGIFDSGFGGLSIFQAIRKALPELEYIYVADQAYVPYGDKSQEVITSRALVLSQWLIDQKVELILVACNTATVCSIRKLRQTYQIPFVGVEPAIKPAALRTQKGRIAVLASCQTLQSQRLGELILRFANKRRVSLQAMPNWLDLVEQGKIRGKKVEKEIRDDLKKLKKPEAIVLACTHYLFFIPIIRKILPMTKIYEPSQGMINRVKHFVGKSRSGRLGSIRLFTTKVNRKTDKIVSHLLRERIPVKLLQL